MNKDIFANRSARAMLIGDQRSTPFDSEDYIFEIKFDGIRALCYMDTNSADFRNKRNKDINNIYPELSQTYKQINNRCILDGEIVVLENGYANFHETQKRALMSNSFKIDVSSKKYPVTFVVYDILYVGHERLTHLTQIQRKEILHNIIEQESERMFVSKYVDTHGIHLHQFSLQHNIEGIVCKRKESKYHMDKRTKEWIKIKNLLDEDFIICGYIWEKPHIASLVLGAYRNDQLTYVGHVHIGVSSQDFKIIQQVQEVSPAKYYLAFPEERNCKWIRPILVCSVHFMAWTENGGLRQPVYKVLRDDKAPEECLLTKPV